MRLGRELPALGLVGLWLFGAVLAPLVHIAMHGSLAPHSHGTSLEAGSCHDGHCHDEDAHEATRSDDDPSEHGRGSLAHGDLAALFPAPALILPPFVAIGERARPAELCGVRDALAPPPTLARGPPAVA